jgi:energy-coupling factor transporter transmembrane protein EcfT
MNRKNTKGEKDSVIAVIILLLLLFLLFKHRGWVYAALAVAVISLLFSSVTYYVHSLWTFLSEILGRISGSIILTLVFIFILIPTAILKKWFGKKDMVLKKKNISSGFLNRNHKYTQADLDNPW